MVERRRAVNPGTVEKDPLVEAIANRGSDGQDENDDIIDRVTGHETKKPGSETHEDIVVPSTSGKTPTPSEVNSKSTGSSPETGKKKAKKGGNEGATDGLEL